MQTYPDHLHAIETGDIKLIYDQNRRFLAGEGQSHFRLQANNIVWIFTGIYAFVLVCLGLYWGFGDVRWLVADAGREWVSTEAEVDAVFTRQVRYRYFVNRTETSITDTIRPRSEYYDRAEVGATIPIQYDGQDSEVWRFHDDRTENIIRQRNIGLYLLMSMAALTCLIFFAMPRLARMSQEYVGDSMTINTKGGWLVAIVVFPFALVMFVFIMSIFAWVFVPFMAWGLFRARQVKHLEETGTVMRAKILSVKEETDSDGDFVGYKIRYEFVAPHRKRLQNKTFLAYGNPLAPQVDDTILILYCAGRKPIPL